MKKIFPASGPCILVDDDDYEEMSKFKWTVLKRGYTFYASRHTKRGSISTSVFMHRAIMNCVHGDGKEVDHINNNGLDNRKKNLRICTRSQNMQNGGLRSTNTSGYKGVSRNKGKWCAEICIDRKKIIIGRFDSKVMAAKAYNRAALKYFGEYARLNDVG